MNNLKSTDKKILETLFEMKGGFVSDFSDRTMSDFFKEQFEIDIYDPKYDFDFLSRSKANRLRGIWLAEDEKTVGAIILSLVDYTETSSLANKKELTQDIKDLSKKAREIGMNLLFSEITNDFQPEILDLKNKTQYIKDFNTYDIKTLKTNEKIYHLKVLYSYYEAIIRAYYGSGLFFVTTGIDTLNDYFKVLRKRIIEIMNSDETFSEIKNSNAYGEVFEPMTSLYTSAEFLDVVWDDAIVPSLINLREEIADKDLFENNSEIHKTSIAVFNFLEAISKEIDILKKYNEQKTKNFYENELPKQKEQFDNTSNVGDEKIIKHEHTHHFENSIQEKDIVLNHKYDKDDPSALYITKKNDDFYYKGKYLDISKTAEYYQVFSSLFAKLPNGGEISYKELGKEIQSRIQKTKSKDDDEMRKFIQGNLTDASNGFVRYAKLPANEDNGKPLIEVIRGSGVRFNNKRG